MMQELNTFNVGIEDAIAKVIDKDHEELRLILENNKINEISNAQDLLKNIKNKN